MNPSPTARVRARRRTALLATALAATLAIGASACSSSSSDGSSKPKATTSTTAALDKGCVFHLDDAKPLVGEGAGKVDPPPLEGLQPPIARCAYGKGKQMVQLTVFQGPEMATAVVNTLMGKEAKRAPKLGAGGACATGKGTEVATATCVWVNQGRSYVLGLTMPLDALTKGTLAKVTTAAESVSARLPSDPVATTTTTTP